MFQQLFHIVRRSAMARVSPRHSALSMMVAAAVSAAVWKSAKFGAARAFTPVLLDRSGLPASGKFNGKPTIENAMEASHHELQLQGGIPMNATSDVLQNPRFSTCYIDVEGPAGSSVLEEC